MSSYDITSGPLLDGSNATIITSALVSTATARVAFIARDVGAESIVLSPDSDVSIDGTNELLHHDGFSTVDIVDVTESTGSAPCVLVSDINSAALDDTNL